MKLIGTGEQLEDLRPFEPAEYARALLASDASFDQRRVARRFELICSDSASEAARTAARRSSSLASLSTARS